MRHEGVGVGSDAMVRLGDLPLDLYGVGLVIAS